MQGTSSGTAPADNIGNANVPDNGGGITGASTTVITRQDIERAPEATIADILSREAGIQTSNFYGGANGVGTTVDMRGFGVTGASNTLILINGRRLNDWDLPGFDLTTLGKNSVERIEVTRGNSGSVLYGDGAVGGVINIVTRNGAGQPSQARIEAGYGSYATREGNVSANLSSGAFSTLDLCATVSIRPAIAGTTACISATPSPICAGRPTNGAPGSISAPTSQKMRLPGERQIDVQADKDEYNRDRRGTNTPLNYGNKQGERYTAGATAMLAPGFEVVVDGGIRKKFQQAGFFQAFGEQYVGTELTTSSFTPRVNINQNWWGIPVKAIGGVDLYRTDYDSDRSPVHRAATRSINMTASRNRLAGYGMVTFSLLPTTDVSVGGRVQRTQTQITDIYDINAPQNFSFPQGGPLDEAQTNRSWHLGFEHRFNDNFAIFGRAATSFRVPNVDERIGNGAIVFPLPPPTFALKTQTSDDIEGGIKFRFGTVPAAIERVPDESGERTASVPDHLRQYQPRSDPPQRRRNTDDLGRHRLAAAEGQCHLPAGAVPGRAVRGQFRAGGVALDRQCRSVDGYLAEIPDPRRGDAIRQRSLSRQRRVQPRHHENSIACGARCAARRARSTNSSGRSRCRICSTGNISITASTRATAFSEPPTISSTCIRCRDAPSW